MPDSNYPRTYAAIDKLEAAVHELNDSMRAELDDGGLHPEAPAVLLLVNDPAKKGTIFSAFGRYDRMAESLATVLDDTQHVALRHLLTACLLRAKMPMAAPVTD